MWQGYSAPCGEVTKAVARLLSPLWRGYQICGKITCGEVTLWRGYLLPIILQQYCHCNWQSDCHCDCHPYYVSINITIIIILKGLFTHDKPTHSNLIDMIVLTDIQLTDISCSCPMTSPACPEYCWEKWSVNQQLAFTTQLTCHDCQGRHFKRCFLLD